MTQDRKSHRLPLLFAAAAAAATVAGLPIPAKTAAKPVLFGAHRSLFVRIDAGVGFDIQRADRSPLNLAEIHLESYAVNAFVIGISAGFRVNEFIGIEGGFTEQRHAAHPEWGGSARYTLGTAALRTALPTSSRQTPFFKIGLTCGAFAYGSSSLGDNDNDTWVLGPAVGLGLEHEWTLGVTGVFQVGYTGLHRHGMDTILVLEEVTFSAEGNKSETILGTKDFSDDAFVHLIWITIGIQFEWTIN